MLIINMATLPRIIELALAIYGAIKLVDKFFLALSSQNSFKVFSIKLLTS